MEALAESNVAAAAKSAARPAAFELKGVMTSLAVLRLFSLDFAAIERQLRLKIEHLPQFFQDAPVVLDLGALSNGGAAVPFAPLKRLLRDCHLIPVAVTNAGDDARVNAVAEGLGIMPYRAAKAASRAAVTVARSGDATPGPTNSVPSADAVARSRTRGVESPAPVAPARPARGGRPAMVIRQPVRSGQVIYAEQSDLVVLAPVNPGAEVIADGNVHLYGVLRGRAIAGAQGYAAAQIFCQRLEAELVGVAGAYVMAEDIPAERRGHAARVCLTDEGECRISAL